MLAGAEVAGSLEEAITMARATDDAPRVIGGAAIYRLAIPLATTVLFTEVERDTFFAMNRAGLRETARRPGYVPGLAFVTLER